MQYNNNWEYGSEFSWLYTPDKEIIDDKLYNKSLFMGTGRCALKLIIKWGKIQNNWNRIWIPSYYCPDVVESILSAKIDIKFYYDDPMDDLTLIRDDYRKGDVLLVNNLFGYRTQPCYENLPRNYIQIIEDHSHDPWSDWSLNSTADWSFASLRKSLPISDGAILWSPMGHQMPKLPQLTPIHYQASLEKFLGMLLKSSYLQEKAVEKETFRNFLTSGEKRIGTTESSRITDFSKKQLLKIPINIIREKKNQNRSILTELIKNITLFKILEAPHSKNSCPFSVIIYFNTQSLQKIFFKFLVTNKIYPALLWPANEELKNNIPESNVDFSTKMLSLHCDFRYSYEDIMRVCETINEIAKRL